MRLIGFASGLTTTYRLLALALGAMFVQQTFAAIGRSLPSVIAPAIMDDLAIDHAWLGVYVAISAAASLGFQLGCGSFILRYGALRMSQAALVMLAIGLGFGALSGPIWFFAVAAIIGGGGAAVSTPASSHLLGRYSPPKYAPLVFSLKQTAVPAGLLFSGILGPFMVALWGWRGALVAAALGCLAFTLMLQPLRRAFDSDRQPEQRFHMSDFLTTITSVTKDRELRALSVACFAFNGLQTVFTSYFVTYLVKGLDYSLAAAGLVFSIVMVIAVPCRILWGWVGSAWVSPRVVMGGLALGMAVSSVLTGLYGAEWPVVLVGLVAAGMSATAMSWHGVLLSETARLAPPGQRGAATGGVLSFGQLGGLLLPLVYALLLGTTGSYGAGFVVGGIPALWVGWELLRRRPGAAAG